MDLDEPQGLRYVPELLTVEEERRLRAWTESVEFHEVALVTRYPPGATIGWHRDAPACGSSAPPGSTASRPSHTCGTRSPSGP